MMCTACDLKLFYFLFLNWGSILLESSLAATEKPYNLNNLKVQTLAATSERLPVPQEEVDETFQVGQKKKKSETFNFS